MFEGMRRVSPGAVVVRTTLGEIHCGKWLGEQAEEAYAGRVVACPVSVTDQGEWPSVTEIRQWWDLESIGIRDSPEVDDDAMAVEFFKRTPRRGPDGRYIVSLPWREFPPDLPSNYNMAYSRLGAWL